MLAVFTRYLKAWAFGTRAYKNCRRRCPIGTPGCDIALSDKRFQGKIFIDNRLN